jgi:hypothetical protein
LLAFLERAAPLDDSGCSTSVRMDLPGHGARHHAPAPVMRKEDRGPDCADGLKGRVRRRIRGPRGGREPFRRRFRDSAGHGPRLLILLFLRWRWRRYLPGRVLRLRLAVAPSQRDPRLAALRHRARQSVLGGRLLWPGVFVGAFAVNIAAVGPLSSRRSGIALGNTAGSA